MATSEAHVQLKIYLAGPDVFFPNPKEIAQRKKQICADYNFEGVFPLDVELKMDETDTKFEIAQKISQSNEALMDGCDLLIANLTPFRGVSMDAGTAFEVGYMRAQGKHVFGYTNTTADYKTRVAHYYETTQDNKNRYDPDFKGHTDVEDFDLAENLMIEIAIAAHGGHVIRQDVEAGQEYRCLKGFEACVEQAQHLLS